MVPPDALAAAARGGRRADLPALDARADQRRARRLGGRRRAGLGGGGRGARAPALRRAGPLAPPPGRGARRCASLFLVFGLGALAEGSRRLRSPRAWRSPMPIDLSVARWTRDVAVTQWNRDDGALAAIGGALPAGNRRASARSARCTAWICRCSSCSRRWRCGSRARWRASAPTPDALAFAAQQTLDEARHHEMFARRLALSTAAWGTRAGGDEILIPPLRKFIDLCYEVADRGAFVDGLVLTNLVLEGMAYPLYGYEERYWKPVDPYLARLIAQRVRRRDPSRRLRRRAGRRRARRRSRGARARAAPDRRRPPRDGRGVRLLRPEVRGAVRRRRPPPPRRCSPTPSWNRGGASPTRPTRSRSPASATASTRSTPDCWGARGWTACAG